jgi:hypothetical protein
MGSEDLVERRIGLFQSEPKLLLPFKDIRLIEKEEACNVPKGAAYVDLSQRWASSVALY